MANGPSHKAFLIEKPEREGAAPFWRGVAVAFTHRDNKGFDLVIPSGMALSGRVVIRERDAERPVEKAATAKPAGPGGRR